MQTREATRLSRVLIVDDHPLFCDALAMTLRSMPVVTDVLTANLLEDALEQIHRGPAPDVILLDLNLPDVNGLDGLIRLHKAAGDTPIVIVSSMADNRMISSVLRAGARGFVPKHSQREVFRDAFETIAEGRVFMPEGFVEVPEATASEGSLEDVVDRLSALTAQQARILQLICEGKLNKQIAYDLSIAETTVKAHVTAIMRKLGVQSRTQAVLLAGQANFANVLPNAGSSS